MSETRTNLALSPTMQRALAESFDPRIAATEAERENPFHDETTHRDGLDDYERYIGHCWGES